MSYESEIFVRILETEKSTHGFPIPTGNAK
jgi:hypothetical protein